jgi:hypothetical protein
LLGVDVCAVVFTVWYKQVLLLGGSGAVWLRAVSMLPLLLLSPLFCFASAVVVRARRFDAAAVGRFRGCLPQHAHTPQPPPPTNPQNKRESHYFMPWACGHERHVYEKCQYKEWKRRVAVMTELKRRQRNAELGAGGGAPA